MKYWYHNSEEETSFYLEPLTWDDLVSQFDGRVLVRVEHLVCSNPQLEIYYHSWHGTSPEFQTLKEPIPLQDLISLLNRLKVYPYEYILYKEELRIERVVIEGVVFSGPSGSIQKLIEGFHIPPGLLSSSTKGELAVLSPPGECQITGHFSNRSDLLEHVYHELMKVESPDYFDFMRRLAEAEYDIGGDS